MKDNKYEKLIAVIGLLSLFCITIGVSYSVFSYMKEGTTDNSIRTESITFLYTEVSKVGNGISISNALPISDSQGKMQTGSGNVFDFKITSTTNNSSIPYEVTARKSKDSTLEESAVKLYLTEVEGNKETQLLLDNYNKLPQTKKVDVNKYSEKVIYNGEVEANSNYEKDFKLRMWIDANTDFSNEVMNNKTFTIKVNVYANAKVVEEKIEKTSDNTLQVVGYSYNDKLWQYKSEITKIIIQNELKPIQGEGILSWNISESGEGSIIAYYDPSTTTAYIQGDGKIYANEDSSGLFNYFTKLTEIEGIQLLDTSYVEDMSGMLASCSVLESLDLSTWDTSQVEIMNSVFAGCYKLIALNISDWNTSKVTNMQAMFQYCNSLKELDLNSWDTSQVANMVYMFYQCRSLESLDLNNWDTSKVTSMYGMFIDCSNLTELNISNFDTSQLKYMYEMFKNCKKLTTTINIIVTNANNLSYTNIFSDAATEEGTEITVNYINTTSTLVNNMIMKQTIHGPGNVVKGQEILPYTVSVPDGITKSTTASNYYPNVTVTLESVSGKTITSFKVNDELKTGNTFKMPAINVTITDVITE